MKKNIKLMLALILGLSSAALMADSALAKGIKDTTRPNDSVLQRLGSEIKNVFNTIKNLKDPKVACRKGEFKLLGQSTYSLRSFNGALCDFVPEIAYYAYLNCTKDALGEATYKEFIDSQCYAKGYKHLKGKSANEAGDLLKQSLMGRADLLKQMICSNVDKTPAFLRSKIQGVCGGSN